MRNGGQGFSVYPIVLKEGEKKPFLARIVKSKKQLESEK
jgi:hypothetical protein